jgi:hypothetical protein
MNKIISYKEFLNESKTITITEGVEEQIKKECISKLSDFFGCAPGNLSKFNFDGKDNIKELTKALRSTSDEGTAQYYRIAIIMAKRDLGIHESEEVNEGFNKYGWFLRLPKKVISNELRSATKNLTSYYKDASSGSDLQQDVLEDIISELETVKNQLMKFSKGEKPTGVYESEEVNEGRTKADLEDSLKTLEDKLRKYKGVRQNSIHPFDPQKKVSDYVAYLETSIKYVKAELAGVNESEEVNEGKKEDLAVQLEAIFAQIKGMNLDKNAEFLFTKAGIGFGFLDMLSKPGAIKTLQSKSPEAKQRIKDAHADLEAAKSTEEVKSILVGLIDTVSESVNEKLDTKYWIGYHDQGDTFAAKEFGIKSKDFKDAFDEAVEDWNNEADGAENQIKGANLKKIEKMAMEFFKIEKWISVNVIQAMIMQES